MRNLILMEIKAKINNAACEVYANKQMVVILARN
jgi:hypothetical protein